MNKLKEDQTVKTYDWKHPIRILDEEVEIFEAAHKKVTISMTYGYSFLSKFNVSICSLPAKILTAHELIGELDPRASYFSGCDENIRDYFYMFWDEKTIAPVIKGMLGGTLESAIRRIDNKKTEMTDIELSLIEEFAVRTLANIRQGFFDIVELRPRLNNVQSDLICIAEDFPGYTLGICIPLQFKWESEGGILIESLTHLFYTQDFIRNYNWRKPKWQNLTQSN